jgi:hypothetical protein
LETQTQIKVATTVIWVGKPLCYKTPNVLKNELLLRVLSLVVRRTKWEMYQAQKWNEHVVDYLTFNDTES